MTDPLAPGSVLARRYQVARVMRSGATTAVVEARDTSSGSRVVLKFLHGDVLPQSEAAARFARECSTAQRLRGEHFVRVLDVGRLDDGSPYMAMEYLEGEPLAAWLERERRLPIATAVDIALQTCEGLGLAHGAGVVHRDLRPANLFLTPSASGAPLARILDFGISKVRGRESQLGELTEEAAVLGLPLYMSPEQMGSSRDVDRRTDIWAMGVVLYEMVAGEPPFNADSLPRICKAVLTQQPVPPSAKRPDCPAGLEQAVARCLAKDRDQRFPDAAALAAAIAPFGPPGAVDRARRVGSLVPQAVPDGPTAPPVPIRPPGPPGVVVHASTPAKSNRWVIVVLVALVALALLVVVVALAVAGVLATRAAP
jgi:serine/threonine-protein kinase